MDMIQFDNVSKKFKKGRKFNSLRDMIPAIFKGNKINNKTPVSTNEFWALHNVTFKVKKSEVLGVIGPNGAGKSTILKLLFKILTPNEGHISISGKVCGLIEITAGFHQELTGRENIYLNGTIIGMRKKEIDQKFDEIVDFSGIEEFIDTPVKRYSSGMYARLGFSVMAHMNPDVLLVDEVLAVGDMAFQSKCAQKMRELLNSGVTIVIVSHNMSLIQNLAKRVILIDKGHVIREGTPEKVIPAYQEIVFKSREEEMKHQLREDKYKLSVSDHIQNENRINVFVYGAANDDPDVINEMDNIKIKIEYKLSSYNAKPILTLELLRADGVLCCSMTIPTSIKKHGLPPSGTLVAALEDVKLGPSVYVVKASMWDRARVHCLCSNLSNVIKVRGKNLQGKNEPVFIPKIIWKMK